MASRSPINGVGYDQSLLAAAPEVTKADKQEGYNPDLLEQGTPTRAPTTNRAPTSRRTPVTLPTNGYNGSEESNNGHKASAPLATGKDPKPRPRKLTYIIIGVVLLVIIAVAVGVGVGVGTKKKGNSNGGNGNNGPVIGSGPISGTNISPTKTDDTISTATDDNSGITTGDGGVKPTNVGSASAASGANVSGATRIPTGDNGAPALPTNDDKS